MGGGVTLLGRHSHWEVVCTPVNDVTLLYILAALTGITGYFFRTKKDRKLGGGRAGMPEGKLRGNWEG